MPFDLASTEWTVIIVRDDVEYHHVLNPLTPSDWIRWLNKRVRQSLVESEGTTLWKISPKQISREEAEARLLWKTHIKKLLGPGFAPEITEVKPEHKDRMLARAAWQVDLVMTALRTIQVFNVTPYAEDGEALLIDLTTDEPPPIRFRVPFRWQGHDLALIYREPTESDLGLYNRVMAESFAFSNEAQEMVPSIDRILPLAKRYVVGGEGYEFNGQPITDLSPHLDLVPVPHLVDTFHRFIRYYRGTLRD
ncbi:MAG: hypothetical protein V2G41_09325 [bacterium JZ-2024 1]